MPKEILDCVIVGYNDFDLPSLMAAREKLQATSGACRQMLGSVFRYGGKWRHHSELLNAVLKEATGRDHHLHTMELPNLAACHLRSFLARKGLEVESVNFFNREKDRLAAWLRDSPRAVAITTSLYVEADPVAEVVRFVRERSPETLIVVGGPHILNVCDIPSLMAQDHLLNRMGADVYIHDSQGEATLARLLRELRKGDRRALGRVPNLVYRAGPAPGAGRASPYVRTPRQIEDNDVNANAIDWGLIPGALSRPTAQMIISRSCPFACSFCRYPALAGPFRTARVDVVERQMKQLRAAGASRLILADDTPNVPLKRFKAIVKMMVESQLQFQWFSNLRCANADAETYDLLAASGCRGVFLGIESGDQTILDNMNKQATVDAYREGIRQLKARDILTYASFIVGFPGETEDTIRNTIRFIEGSRSRGGRSKSVFPCASRRTTVPLGLDPVRRLSVSDEGWRLRRRLSVR